MKSWVLGEELSTMRFTTLIRASLSLICSRGGNGRLRCSPGGGSPTPPGSGSSPGPQNPLCSRPPLTRCELWFGACTEAAHKGRPWQGGGRWPWPRPGPGTPPWAPERCGPRPAPAQPSFVTLVWSRTTQAVGRAELPKRELRKP